MKIQVTRGEVAIRTVIVRRHLADARIGCLYTVEISTPLDKHPIATIGYSLTPLDGLSQRIELFRARRPLGDFNPSVIVLTPDSQPERLALDGGLSEIEWNRWGVMMLAISPTLMAAGLVVESWEQFERGGADYIEGGQLE
jgi:hypothetical protein